MLYLFISCYSYQTPELKKINSNMEKVKWVEFLSLNSLVVIFE